MVNIDKEPGNSAENINRWKASVERMILRHSIAAASLTILSTLIFIGAYAGLVFLFPAPDNVAIIKQLDKSSGKISEISKQLAHAGLIQDIKLRTELIQVIVRQAEEHRDAIKELEKQETKIDPQGIGLLQLLGGTAVLAILGYLGLHRLQTIDSELTANREFMFAQIRERAIENREVLTAAINSGIDKHFEKTKLEMESLTEHFLKLTEESTAAFTVAHSEAQDAIGSIEDRITKLLERYNWLDSAELRQAADVVQRLTSVEQAHDAAVKMNSKGMSEAAHMALDAIMKKELKGDAADYHNAHTEAMNMKDTVLAFQIAEKGLSEYGNQFDLMADKARCLISLGDVQGALGILEGLQKEQPMEFYRSWRPIVFYAKAVQAAPRNDENIDKLVNAFNYAVQQLPYQIKIWSSFAQFLDDIGRFEESEKVLVRAVEKNPFSQQLNYVLGEKLLRQGGASKAIPFLENALKYDYQEQYQHDISQEAVRVTLAEVYEANGLIGKARIMYELTHTLANEKTHRHIANYVKNRLIAIQAQDVLNGNLTEPQPPAPDAQQTLRE